MRRIAVAVGMLFVMGACGVADRGPLFTQPEQQGTGNNTALTSCPVYTFAQLETLLFQVYAAGSPDANAALGKLNNLQHQIDIGDTDEAKTRAWDIATFTLQKRQEGKLIGSEEDVVNFLNGVLCYAGLTALFTGADNTWLINPGDGAQTFITDDGWAGVQIPASNVSEPTVLTIARLADDAEVLDTDLDQYPLNYDFSIANLGGTGWINPVTVGICPQGGLAEDVNAALLLGHQDAVAGFELLPPADASFLDCSTAPLINTRVRSGVTAARIIAGSDSTVATAIGVIGSSGVGGTADAFSPIAPVDPRIYGSAGVGGTADAFRPRAGITAMSLASGSPCSPLEAPIGTAVHSDCRPTVTFETLLGTALDGIPVTWQVESGGGSIAPNAAGCGAFGSPFIQNTSSAGVTSACWTLGGTPGTNTVVATAGIGGDAIAGVQFVYTQGGDKDNADPTKIKIRFTAEANPPVALAFSTQPAAGAQVTAGANIPVIVDIVDKNGDAVAAFNGPVSVSINQHAFAAGSVTSVSAVNGVATFSALSIEKAATGYQLVAAAALGGSATTTTGNSFDVVAATPVSMTKVAGDNQTAAAGSAVAVNPKVQVSDAYGNPVPGLVVNFVPQNNGAVVTGASPSTAADGTASVGSWTLIDGPNSLLASLAVNNLVFVTFSATGSSSLAVLNSCPLGGSSDPMNYPFYAPGENMAVRQVELFLSSNGSANMPRQYRIALDARLNGFNQPVVATTTVDVTLTGKTSEALPTVFRFPTAFASGKNTTIAFELRVLANPDGAGLFYNTGPCGLGGCKPPKGCSVIQATATTPFPLGTVRRQSVAIRILGG